MRKLIGILGLGLFSVALGCQHVGGKCDMCSATPGDASLYAPLTNYQTPNVPYPVPSPAPEATPPVKKDEFKKIDTRPMAEELKAPKEMPKR